MEKLVVELKKIITFKDSTDVGDIVLIAAKQPEMLIYAYINAIERDDTRKDEWWNVGLSVLSLPPQHMTWTLRTAQMTGMEIFTMGGEERFIKALDFSSAESLHLEKKADKKNDGFIKRIK
ncbi:MAG: hypothetical protein V2I36_01090 [Desulfopila sp.]|jgi:hypothetical protein|nr:hypothetical protein [Desulfopila sp.]